MSTITTRAGKGSELTHNELDANFKRPVVQKTSAYTIVGSDNRSLIECSHASTPFTITLGDANTMDNEDTGDFEVTIANINAAAVTVSRSGSDTIDGSSASIVLSQNQSVTLKVNSTGDGYISVSASTIPGLTSTVDELNILDGVTSTASELNILDGVTAEAADINLLDGVNDAESGYTRSGIGTFTKDSVSSVGLTYNSLTGISAPTGAKGLLVWLRAICGGTTAAGQVISEITSYSDAGSTAIGRVQATAYSYGSVLGQTLATNDGVLLIPVVSGNAYVKFSGRATTADTATYTVLGYTI